MPQKSFTFDSDLLNFYFYYAAILVSKYYLVTASVGFARIKHFVPANPEDETGITEGILKYIFYKDRVPKAQKNHEEVDRHRRSHLNDVENIPFFLVISLIYIVSTNPSLFWTSWLIRIYAWSRIVYSLCYGAFKTHYRIFVYQIGAAINFYLSIRVILHFLLTSN